MRFHLAHGFALFCLLLTAPLVSLRGTTIHVSPAGNDRNSGTALQPFGTLARAQTEAQRFAGREAVTVFLHRGTYYLNAPLVFTSADSGTKQAPVIYEAAPGEKPVISGGLPLKLVWAPYKDGIYQAKVPDDQVTEELFVNGERQILARYPNFDASAQYFNGFAEDAISKERTARWADPAGGYFHAMHKALWGGFTWLITGKDANGEVTKEGGWQNNREGKIHEKYRFVENIFEELDAPGEWFLNRKTHTLYFYPPAGLDLRKAVIEATRLRSLVEVKGEEKAPVRFVTLSGLTFRHAARTFMDTKEPLLRSDWTIHRGGAIFFDGAEDCALEDSLLDQLGGNAVFVNNYNRRITVRGCEIVKAGASGICFIGDPKSVRSALLNYNEQHKLEELDRTPGPLTNNYPADCLVEDCLIHLTGRVEKQTAGVAIDIAQNITVRHCSIYDMPRAGINIGDGCFGGHVIEFCDVFDTVKETGDHGSFNSWGRDRFWRSDVNGINAWEKQEPDLPMLDAVKPTTIRNSRWRCDHGWDIDLDDGSTNYVITNNLCLNGGIKNREGFHRIVENNVMVNNSFHPHVWPEESGDVFRHNIVFAPYKPAIMLKTAWGKEMDYNLVHQVGRAKPQPANALQAQSGRDEHSVIADALFVDPAKGDFRVREGSPALALGFKNFPMDQFGVQKPALKLLARTPSFNYSPQKQSRRNAQEKNWLGAKVRNIVGEAEMSAYGTPGETGVLVLEVPAGGALEAAGLKMDDVILKLDGMAIDQCPDLLRRAPSLQPGKDIKIGIQRLQKEITIPLHGMP
jgi:PDZ domain/Right handed beta helix region